jgi:tetratricopeptide (TPR) repeat protein
MFVRIVDEDTDDDLDDPPLSCPSRATPKYDDSTALYLRAVAPSAKLRCPGSVETGFARLPPTLDTRPTGGFYVKAANAAKETGDVGEFVRLSRMAKSRFLEKGQGSEACLALKDAAQGLLESDPDLACELYEELLDCAEMETTHSQEAGAFVDYAILHLKRGDYVKSFAAWDRAKDRMLFLRGYVEASYCICGKIAICLQQGDVAAAESFFESELQEYYFVKGDVWWMIRSIIRGVRKHYRALLLWGQQSFCLRCMPAAIANILLSLEVEDRPQIPDPKLTNAELRKLELEESLMRGHEVLGIDLMPREVGPDWMWLRAMANDASLKHDDEDPDEPEKCEADAARDAIVGPEVELEARTPGAEERALAPNWSIQAAADSSPPD